MSTFKTAILLLLISASLISADVEEEKDKSEDVDVERLEDAKELNILEGLENGKIEGVEDEELTLKREDQKKRTGRINLGPTWLIEYTVGLGPKNRCGTRRLTYCTGKITSSYASCGLLATPHALKFVTGAYNAYNCFAGWQYTLYRKCRICLKSACEAVVGQYTDKCRILNGSLKEKFANFGV